MFPSEKIDLEIYTFPILSSVLNHLIKEKIVIIHKIGLYMVERIKMSGPIAKTKSKIDVKKKVQYEYKLFVF